MQRKTRPNPFLAIAILAPLLAMTQAEEAKTLESILPADTLYFATVPDFDAFKEGLIGTPLGKLISPDQPSVAAGLGLNFLKLGLQMFSGATIETWAEHLGAPIGLAVLKPDGQQGRGKKGQPPLVLLCRLLKGSESFKGLWQGTIRPTLLNNAPKIELRERRLRNFTVEDMNNRKNNQQVSFTFLPNHLLIGKSSSVDRILNNISVSGPTLASLSDLKKAKGKIQQQPAFWSFFNVAETIAPILEQMQERPKKLREFKLSGLPNLASLSSSLRFEDGSVVERFYLNGSSIEPEGLALLFTRPQPMSLTGAKLIPAHYPIYVSVNYQDGMALVETFENILVKNEGEAGKQKLEEGRQFIENLSGVNLREELFARLSGELFFAMDIPGFKESMLENGDPPQKKDWSFLFGLSVIEAGQLKNSVNKFLNSKFAFDSGLTYEVFKEGGAEIIQARNQKKKNNGLGLCFLDEFVIISNSIDVIKESIKARISKKTVADDPDFQERMKPIEAGSNLAAHFGVRESTRIVLDIVEHFAHPTALMFLKELKPVATEFQDGFATGSIDQEGKGFTIDLKSSQGLGIHILSVVLLAEAIKSSPGYRIVRTERSLDRIEQALNNYYQNNGSFPPTLEALHPKYLKRKERDHFSSNRGKFAYHPGPVTIENDRKLYLTGWIFASPGPDRRLDLALSHFDPVAFQKRLNSGTEADEDYLRRVTYQYKPDKFPLENRLLDSGDIYRIGAAPQ